MSDVIELHTPKPSPALSWVDVANKEIAGLQEAAKDPKKFFGNRVVGMGEGLARVKALHYAAKNIEQALSALNRVL